MMNIPLILCLFVNLTGAITDLQINKLTGLQKPRTVLYQGKYVVSPMKSTWQAAKTACAGAGLQLAKIRSKEELSEMLEAITFFLGPKEESWRRWNANNWVWLGGNDLEREGEFVWVDGEEIKWELPWERKAGNDNWGRYMREGQDVLALSRWGTVDDSFRLKKFRPFACQSPRT